MMLIDTDPGLDDAHALAMALGRVPAADLIVTTVAGNVGIDEVTKNARLLVGAISPDVPVHRGAAGPLVGPAVAAAHIHGDDGMAGFDWGDGPISPLSSTPAATAIVDAARRYGRDLTIVALGPLTNLALAIRLDPSVPERIGPMIAMGGSPAGYGNASINAEFNVYADPVASEIVYSAVRDLTLITWDLTLTERFTRAEVEAFWPGDSAAARTLRAIHDHRTATEPGYAAQDDFGRVDPLAMAIALDHRVVVTEQRHPVVVGYGGGLDHGLTAVDWRDAHPDRPAVRLPMTIDRARATSLYTL
ncbi:nucleoside hydrolase [Microbacterium sp.]|uniref:nucleoside hydrolase n=1 Tax=Microbacterium sp. TaxID=51671 RepID=UPI003A8AF71F